MYACVCRNHLTRDPHLHPNPSNSQRGACGFLTVKISMRIQPRPARRDAVHARCVYVQSISLEVCIMLKCILQQHTDAYRPCRYCLWSCHQGRPKHPCGCTIIPDNPLQRQHAVLCLAMVLLLDRELKKLRTQRRQAREKEKQELMRCVDLFYTQGRA